MPDNAFFLNACRQVSDDLDERRTVRERLNWAFNKLGLPEPEPNEFISGVGNHGVVFLHQAGCVARIVNDRKTPLFRHRNLMRPIGSIKLGQDIRLDIQYSGICPIEKADLTKVANRLMETIQARDYHNWNWIYDGIETSDFPKGTPVLFDPASLKRLNNNVRQISETLGHNGCILSLGPKDGEEPDDQDTLYADLRDKFNMIFLQDGEDIGCENSAVDIFWRSMIEATDHKRLVPSWMTPEKSDDEEFLSRMKQKSLDYDERLKAHNPVFQMSTSP